MPTALDRFAPDPDAREVHEILIRAAPARCFEALRQLDFTQVPALRILLFLRAIPALLVDRRKPAGPVDIAVLQRLGFGTLAETEGRELVLGVHGRFWRPVAAIETFDRDDFDGPVPPGTARAVWSFSAVADGGGRTRFATETRVLCADPASRRYFRAYWTVIRPLSGWVRRLLLRAVRRRAEALHGGS